MYFSVLAQLFLDKADQFSRVSGSGGPETEEVAGHVQTGTRPAGRVVTDTGPGDAIRIESRELAGLPGADNTTLTQPGGEGTLLAVVPIPGTGTSLAIVGYPVTTAGTPAGPGLAALVSGHAVPAAAPPPGTLVPGQGAGEGEGEGAGLRLDYDQRRVLVDGAEVPLTFQEFELLAFLAAHPATVFSRADLVRRVWQRDFGADSRTVDVHVSRLRAKLGQDYGKCLVTEYRVGYQFRPVAG
jgi:Transcriptional regulatory protein, C terminal